MFSKCIDRVGHQKERKKIKKTGNNGTYHKSLSEEYRDYRENKFLIPVYKIYLYVTLPPSGLYYI